MSSGNGNSVPTTRALLHTGTAHAQDHVDADTVLLRNGGVVRGSVLYCVPGEPVRVRTFDGRDITVPAEDVAEVSLADARVPAAADRLGRPEAPADADDTERDDEGWEDDDGSDDWEDDDPDDDWEDDE